MRYLKALVILIAASMACSRGPDRPMAALPTSPSSTAVSANYVVGGGGGVSGPMIVNFPSPADTLLFRNELEGGYQAVLGRSATNATYVDREGEAVWIQLYMYLRANGCAHVDAITKVLAQIDLGGGLAAICQAPSEFFEAQFPTRADVVDMRMRLEEKYRAMGRSVTLSAVDIEGAAIWIQEYLRYRANGCDHATAMQKTLVQLQGSAPPPTCFVPCSYVLTPGGFDTGPAATNQSFEVRPNPVACPWTAESNVPWITFPRENEQGNGFFTFPYSIAQNLGGDRSGFILFRYATGTQTFRVTQTGSPFVAGFTMIDPARGPENTTECHFKSTLTSCILRAFANLPGNVYTYEWVVTYVYGTQKTIQLTTSADSTLTITDSCGGPGSGPDAPAENLSVQLIIRDDRGNSVTILTNHNWPQHIVRLFSCP